MQLYLHYTRTASTADAPAFATGEPVPTYALGHFERNHLGHICLKLDGNGRTTDQLTTAMLHGQSILDSLRDVDGNPTRLQATGINSDEDEALLVEAQAQGWRVSEAQS